MFIIEKHPTSTRTDKLVATVRGTEIILKISSFDNSIRINIDELVDLAKEAKEIRDHG